MKNKYSKRDPIKDYFPLPNEIFFIGLSYGEIAVYAYLLYRENRETFQCYPSYKTIGKSLKMSRNTVSKYVKQLEYKELISTEQTNVFTSDLRKLNGNLLYKILPIEQAKKHYYNQQLKKIEQVVTENRIKKKLEKLNLKPKEETA